MTKPTITIAGAGLAGALLAGLLAEKGYTVSLFEKRPNPELVPDPGGRSINLALSARGWRALGLLGLEAEVRRVAVPMYGRMVHGQDLSLTFQPYGHEGQAIYSVSRADLNRLLVRRLAAFPNVKVHFGHHCQEVRLPQKKALFRQPDGSVTEHDYELLVGADGAFSKVRLAMQQTDRFNFRQHFIEHGYKELHIPPSPAGDFRLRPDALHIWPRHQFMLIALPNPDRSFTATLFLDFDSAPEAGAPPSFARLTNPSSIHHFFEEYFPDTLRHFGALEQEFMAAPTASLVTTRSTPWHYGHHTFLIGDSAHALVPFYGQGMNCSFEDCRVLIELLEENKHHWTPTLEQFQALRIPDTNAIADLAMQNFVEMRHLVADELFLLRKKIEARLHQLYPTLWIPLYSMVTFSHIRYSQALQLGKIQDQVMREVMASKGILKHWEQMDLGELPPVRRYLAEREREALTV